METDSSPVAEKQPKLRWFQYSLRSLFLLTLFVAIGMSWLTVTRPGNGGERGRESLILPDEESQPLAVASARWADSGNSIGAKIEAG